MKRTRICPKCNGNEIYRINGYTGAYGSGNNIMTGATIFSTVNVNRYVCGRCGYSEEWIDEGDLQKIKESKKAFRV